MPPRLRRVSCMWDRYSSCGDGHRGPPSDGGPVHQESSAHRFCHLSESMTTYGIPMTLTASPRHWQLALTSVGAGPLIVMTYVHIDQPVRRSPSRSRPHCYPQGRQGLPEQRRTGILRSRYHADDGTRGGPNRIACIMSSRI